MARPSDSRDTDVTMSATPTRVASPTQVLLEDMLRRSLIAREDWDALPAVAQEEVRRQLETERLLSHLVQLKLLTEFQARCIRASKMSGMVFGNYRVLGQLGAGGMGVVYKAEHVFLRRIVALKVLPNPFEDGHQLLPRFLSEIRSVARLQHPNIVAALDAGKTRGSDVEPANYYYFAMEYVPGEDLEQQVLCGQAGYVASSRAIARSVGRDPNRTPHN